MYQFVEDLKEEQYYNFLKKYHFKENRKQESIFYAGIAKDRRLVAGWKFYIQDDKKRILHIPSGIFTIDKEEEFYIFLKKYLIHLAYSNQIYHIQVESNHLLLLEKIGFQKKQKKKPFLLTDTTTKVDFPSYFSIEVLQEEKDWNVLKELKTSNASIFHMKSIAFYTLQLDLLSYHDYVKKEEERHIVEKLMREFGNQLLLESIAIQKLSDTEVNLLDTDNYSTFLQEERDSILISTMKNRLHANGIHTIHILSKSMNSNIQEETVEIYEIALSPFYHLTKKRRD